MAPPSTSVATTVVDEDPGMAMAEADFHDSAGLSRMQWVLIWFAMMIVFLIGVLVYDVRKH
jgi:hypothetical protein